VGVASITVRRLVVLASITVVLLVAPGRQLAVAHDDGELDTTPDAGETLKSVDEIIVDFAGAVEGASCPASSRSSSVIRLRVPAGRFDGLSPLPQRSRRCP